MYQIRYSLYYRACYCSDHLKKGKKLCIRECFFFRFLKINERNEDSCIGRCDFFVCFFSGKSLKNLITLNFDFSGFDLLFLFKLSAFPLLKRSQTPISNSKSVKVRTKGSTLVSKVEFKYQISQWNKIFTY